MKLLTNLIFCFLTSITFGQVYEDNDGPFYGGSLKLEGNTYLFTEYFCTGTNYSQGIFHQHGDTLFLSSIDSFDNHQPYGPWFIKMVNEPFLMKGNGIYPVGKVIESYLLMVKKE